VQQYLRAVQFQHACQVDAVAFSRGRAAQHSRQEFGKLVVGAVATRRVSAEVVVACGCGMVSGWGGVAGRRVEGQASKRLRQEQEQSTSTWLEHVHAHKYHTTPMHPWRRSQTPLCAPEASELRTRAGCYHHSAPLWVM